MPSQGPTWNSHCSGLASVLFVSGWIRTYLSGHDLSVGARDLDAGVQAGLVVSEDNVALHDVARPNTTVVLELGGGEAALGPAVRPVIVADEGVLLLEAEPRLRLLVEFHRLGTLVAVVKLIGRTVGVPAFREDEDVRRAGEGVGEDGDRLQVDIRVAVRRLARRGTVKVPCREGVGGVLLFREGLQAVSCRSRVVCRRIDSLCPAIRFSRWLRAGVWLTKAGLPHTGVSAPAIGGAVLALAAEPHQKRKIKA